MNIYAIGTIFVQLTLGMNAFITAQGFARTSMLSVLIGAVINIVLDPVFIFGFGMGVKGAALANGSFPGMFLYLGAGFLMRKENASSPERKKIWFCRQILFGRVLHLEQQCLLCRQARA